MSLTSANFTEWTQGILDFLYPTRTALQFCDGPAYKWKTQDNYWEGEGFPEEATSMDCVLGGVQKHLVDSGGLALHSGRIFAYYFNDGNHGAVLGHVLSPLFQKQQPLLASIENEVHSWLRGLVAFPQPTQTWLTSGSSTAVLIGVLAALENSQDITDDKTKLVLYCSNQAHNCIQKALNMVGLGVDCLREVASDEKKVMVVKDLQKRIMEDKKAGLHPFLVIGTMGTVDSGSMDPIAELVKVASEERVWLHIDAAYGGGFLLLDDIKDRNKGIGMVDSVSISLHKMLHQPLGLGCVLVQNLGGHASTRLDAKARLLISNKERVSHAFPFWVSLKLLGTAIIHESLAEKLHLAAHAYQVLQNIPGIVLGPSNLSLVTWRCSGDGDRETANAKTTALLREILVDGRVALSSTQMDGYIYIRIAIVSKGAHQKEVDTALDIIQEKLLGESSLVQPRLQALQYQGHTEMLKSLESKLIQQTPSTLATVIEAILGHHPITTSEVVQVAPPPDRWVGISSEPTRLDQLLEYLRPSGATETPNNDSNQNPEVDIALTLAKLTATSLNCCSPVHFMHPGAATLEWKLVEWLISLVGYEAKTARGALEPSLECGTVHALLAARQWCRSKSVNMGSLTAYHTSEDKTCRLQTSLELIGIHNCEVTQINVSSDEESYSMALERMILSDQPHKTPFLLFHQLNLSPPELTKEAASVAALASVARTHGLWLHIEIQPCILGLLIPEVKELLAHVMSQADSVSGDVIGMLSEAFSCGVYLVRRGELIIQALDGSNGIAVPNYFRDKHYSNNTDSYSTASYSMELNRPFRALWIWFLVQLLGTRKIITILTQSYK